jgi:hypothetical protein
VSDPLEDAHAAELASARTLQVPSFMLASGQVPGPASQSMTDGDDFLYASWHSPLEWHHEQTESVSRSLLWRVHAEQSENCAQ